MVWLCLRCFLLMLIVGRRQKNPGIATPMSAPINTNGFMMSKLTILPVSAARSPGTPPTTQSPLNPAAPIAKPFRYRLRCIPRRSSSSVTAITSSLNPDCSATPFALSTIGPYASLETVKPTMESMPTAAMEMPKTPKAHATQEAQAACMTRQLRQQSLSEATLCCVDHTRNP